MVIFEEDYNVLRKFIIVIFLIGFECIVYGSSNNLLNYFYL